MVREIEKVTNYIVSFCGGVSNKFFDWEQQSSKWFKLQISKFEEFQNQWAAFVKPQSFWWIQLKKMYNLGRVYVYDIG